MKYLKKWMKKIFLLMGIRITRIRKKRTTLPSPLPKTPIPDQESYLPLYAPWNPLAKNEFNELIPEVLSQTLVSRDRCYVLFVLAKQSLRLPGQVYECGVYKGGTALLLANLIRRYRTETGVPVLRLFDSFEGMPPTDPAHDLHQKGDFSDTSVDQVRALVGPDPRVEYHPGWIPATFAGREADRICFAHIDVDIYRSVLDCCDFIYPRLCPGGILVFDDYGFPSCPGARQAVDVFFRDKPEEPLVLSTGQAIVFKLG